MTRDDLPFARVSHHGSLSFGGSRPERSLGEPPAAHPPLRRWSARQEASAHACGLRRSTHGRAANGCRQSLDFGHPRTVQIQVMRVLSGMTERASGADDCARAAPPARGVASMATTPTAPVQVRPGDGPDPARAGHIGRIVAGSLATGLVAALLLVAAPFISPEEDDVTGAVLCGFAVGWAMLAILSSRSTDQPQRWAVPPAMFMGLGGLLLIAFGSSSREVLNWVWPPVLLALVIWMFVRARRQLHSRSRRWLLYPVLAVLAVASVGGGYETVRERRTPTHTRCRVS